MTLIPTDQGSGSARVILLVIALAVLPYANALSAGFTLDDEVAIRKNPAVTGGVDVIRALVSPLSPGDLYRPLTVLTFALNEAVAPGRARPFHVVNVLLHAAVSVLVLMLAKRLTSPRIAVIAGALFALHPIHTEAVTSLVGRAELLAALFGLTALLTATSETHGPMRRATLQAVSVTAFSLAVLSKESALTIVPLIPLFRIALRGEALGSGLHRELRSLDWVPYGLCAGLFLALRFYVLGTVTPYTVTPLDNVLAFVPPAVRIQSALGVLWDYFGSLSVPLVLSADYSYNEVPIINSWNDPRCLAGSLLLCAAAVAVVCARRPAVRFTVAFPFVALLLTANLLFPIGTVKAERLLYLPSVGWALLVACMIDPLLQTPRYRAVCTAGVLLVVLAFAARTWARNEDWKDNPALFASMARSAPHSAKSQYNLGTALQESGAHTAAIAQFEHALAIASWTEGAALGIGIEYEKMGRPDEAIAWYHKALQNAPDYHDAHTNLCHVLVNNDRFAAATTACRNGLRYHPTDANLLKGLGASLVALGETDKGIEVLRRSLMLNSSDHELQIYVAQLEQTPGGPSAAVRVE